MVKRSKARSHTGWVQNLTQRKRPEEALRESEQRLRSTLDCLLEGCQVIGFDWRYLYVNDAVARHGRRTKEELLGHTMMEMYPGIEETEMFGFLRRCMEQRVPHRMENEFAYPNGAKGWFELSIQPLPEGIRILSLDFTERKRAEEALRESEQRFFEVFHASPLAMSISRIRDGCIIDANDGLLRMMGYPREAVIGRTSIALGLPVDPGDREKGLQLLEEEGRVRDFEVKARTKSGEVRDILISAAAIELGGELRLLAMSTDITERKRMEEALQRAREELEAKVERQLGRKNPYKLTFRELTVLHLVAAGRADKEIANELGISPLTVHKHVANVLGKMGASSRTEAGVRALREGLVE